MENQATWCKSGVTKTSFVSYKTFLLVNMKNKSVPKAGDFFRGISFNISLNFLKY